MARIPDDVVARIKAETSLERLVTSAGVELERRGKNLVGRCPFHEDRTPSLMVSPGKNLWHCMGASCSAPAAFCSAFTDSFAMDSGCQPDVTYVRRRIKFVSIGYGSL